MATSTTDLAGRRCVQVPRLKYRQSTLDVNSPRTDSLASDQASIPVISTPSTQPENLPSPGLSLSGASNDYSSRRESVAASSFTSSSLAPPRTPNRGLKRGKGFLSSLFATKEPSAVALAQYEKQLRSQGTIQNGKVSAIGMSGVSSAKLPADVPRVNSKWDGVPLSVKEAEKMERKASHDGLSAMGTRPSSDRSLSSNSATSLRTAARRPGSKGTFSAASVYTSHSDQSRNQLADLYGWEIEGYADGAYPATPNGKAASTQSIPIITAEGAAIEPSEPPKIPRAYSDTASAQSSSPGPPIHSHSPSLTPKEDLPATPQGHSPQVTIGTDSEKTLHEPQDGAQDTIRTTTIEAPTKVDEVIINSSGINILAPPLTAKRKSKQLLNDTPEDGKKEPKSILKKESTPEFRRQAQPPLTRTTEPLYGKTTIPALTQRQMHDTGGLGFLNKPPEQVPPSAERATTPTPEAGSLRRRSKLGVFGRRKSLDEQKLREYFETY